MFEKNLLESQLTTYLYQWIESLNIRSRELPENIMDLYYKPVKCLGKIQLKVRSISDLTKEDLLPIIDKHKDDVLAKFYKELEDVALDMEVYKHNIRPLIELYQEDSVWYMIIAIRATVSKKEYGDKT